jgi:exosortase
MRALKAELSSVLGAWRAAARRHPLNAALAAVLAAVLAWIYWGIILGIAESAVSNALWYHCLVVPAAAVCIWWKRRALIEEAPRSSSWGAGLALIGVAGLLLLAELGAGGYFFGGASMVFAVAAVIALLQGRERLRRSLFPVGFLLLGVPVPLEAVGVLGFPLQHISALLTQLTCQVMGLPVGRDGVVLTLGDFSAEVAGSCSGMNSLFALLMVAAWVLGFSRAPARGKLLISLGILPAVIVANVTRLVVMMVVALLLGGNVALSFFHEGSDLVLFLIVVSFLLAAKLRAEGVRLPREAPPDRELRWVWEPLDPAARTEVAAR